MSFNSGLGMARSYYAATANAFDGPPRLQDDARADVVVIGGGYTGLHAALACAERGYSVILVEAGRIGWGASGRNGGQMIPGWRKGAVELVQSYGQDEARRLFAMGLEARKLVLDSISKHRIACDLVSNGHLSLAAKSRDLGWMRREAETLSRVMNYADASVIGAEEAREKVASASFHGGLLDKGGGHLHPLNYAFGLADAARRAGVKLYAHTPALGVQSNRGVAVSTIGGTIRARFGVLACDAMAGGVEPRFAGRIMPVGNYLVATQPLAEPRALIADSLAVSDSRFVINYFRLTADNRLIFSGGERYTPESPPNIEAFVRPYMLRVFPQLAETRIEHAWGGLVSITMSRMPHIGRQGDLFFAHGYSGQGVLLSALAGNVLAEAMAGTAERFDVLAKLTPPEFPGGQALRTPLYVLGMLYYALRDRI